MTAGSHRQKLQILAAGMVLAFAMSFALMPWMPKIKQLCTPTFIFYSLGWVLFMLIGFYLLIEVCGWRKAAFPLVVVGMNSIFIYSIRKCCINGWTRLWGSLRSISSS